MIEADPQSEEEPGGWVVRKRGGGRVVFHHNLGALVLAARKERSLTQDQLAQRAGVSRSLLSRIEREQLIPSTASILLIADALDLPPSQFFADESETKAGAELLLNDARAARHQEKPEECLRLLDVIGDHSADRATVLSLRGWAYLALSREEEALEVLRVAVPAAEEAGDARLIAEARGRLASAEYKLQHYDECRRVLEGALPSLRAVNDPILVGQLMSLLGHAHSVLGNMDTAVSHYEMARRAFGGVSSLSDIAATYSGRSHALRQRGDLNGAVRFSRLALGIFEAQTCQREAALESNNLAERYREAGNLQAARESADRAIEWAVRAHADDLEALARTTRAGVLLEQGEVDEARREAEAVLQQATKASGRIGAMTVLARVAVAENDRDNAAKYFESTLDALRDMGDWNKYGGIALAYGEALRTWGAHEESAEWFRAAALRSHPAR